MILRLYFIMEVLVVLKPLIHSWSQAVQEVEHMIFQDNFFCIIYFKKFQDASKVQYNFWYTVTHNQTASMSRIVALGNGNYDNMGIAHCVCMASAERWKLIKLNHMLGWWRILKKIWNLTNLQHKASSNANIYRSI